MWLIAYLAALAIAIVGFTALKAASLSDEDFWE